MEPSVRLRRRSAAYEPATALSSADLSDRTTSGVGWTVFWRFATRGLGLISTLILARLLVPADFGLVALASSFVVAIDALATTGVYDVLIREPGFQPRLYDTAFTIALIRGIVTATALASLAGPAGGFFDEPRLTPILLVLAAGSLIDSAENTGTVDFRKYMRFDREFVLLLLPRILGIMITIAAAVLFQSYWALVIGSLLQKVVRVILGYVLHPYRPRLSLAAWRQILSFSIWLWAIAVAWFLRERSDTMIVGRMLDPFNLGLYLLSTEIAALPATEFVLPVCRVLFSSFAAARNLNANLRSTFLNALGIVTAIVLPAGVGLALVSPALVPLMLGSAWAGAVPLVSILAPFGPLGAIAAISSTALIVTGYPNVAFAAGAVMAVARILLLVLGIHSLGIAGAAWATGICLAIECILFTGLALRFFGIRAVELISRAWRSVVATAIMAIILVNLGLSDQLAGSMFGSPPMEVIIISCTGALIYVSSHLTLWLLSQRPAGAESFLLAQLSRVYRQCLRVSIAQLP
jgi:O-antigen/teichoic acid export membrane protein